MESSDVLLQWQDESGAWQRGYAVETHSEQFGVRWYYDDGCEIYACEPKDITNESSEYPLGDYPLLVMPLYSTRPVAIWVEIGKLTVVPPRSD